MRRGEEVVDRVSHHGHHTSRVVSVIIYVLVTRSLEEMVVLNCGCLLARLGEPVVVRPGSVQRYDEIMYCSGVAQVLLRRVQTCAVVRNPNAPGAVGVREEVGHEWVRLTRQAVKVVMVQGESKRRR